MMRRLFPSSPIALFVGKRTAEAGKGKETLKSRGYTVESAHEWWGEAKIRLHLFFYGAWLIGHLDPPFLAPTRYRGAKTGAERNVQYGNQP